MLGAIQLGIGERERAVGSILGFRQSHGDTDADRDDAANVGISVRDLQTAYTLLDAGTGGECIVEAGPWQYAGEFLLPIAGDQVPGAEQGALDRRGDLT